MSVVDGTTERRPTAPAVFTRKATGLVREGKTRDALIYNVMWSSTTLTFAFLWLFYGGYVGANAVISMLLAAALGMIGAFLYALLATMMPRTGGDYVFNSRALHPAIGFAGNLTYTLWLILTAGVYTTFIAAYGFDAFSRTMAGFGAGAGWLEFGEWFSTSWGLFITGTAVTIVMATMLALGGARLFFRVQVFFFVAWLLGAVLVPIAVGFLGDPGSFVTNFNEYGANLGATDAAGALAASAGDAGYVAGAPFDTEHTLKAVTVFWFIFGFIFSSAFFAGEIRLKKRTHLYSMPGAVLLAAVILVLLIGAFTNAIGYDLLQQLSLADPAAYGFAAGAPAYPELIGIASGSGLIGAVAIIGFTAALVLWIPQTLFLCSRNIFAWSFDRVVPERISTVDPRTRSPLVAIAVMTVLAIGSTAIYAFTDWFSSLAVLLGLTLPFLVTAVAGMVLPFRQPALVENSPYNRRILGVPMLTLVGGAAVLGFSAAIAVLLWDPGSGTSLSEAPGKVVLVAGVYVAALALWFVARAVRRRQGIDIDLAYRELPAE